MGRRTVRHRDIRRKRRSEKEESIKKEKVGQRGDHPTRNGPESFLYCPRLWRSSTGFLSQRLEPKWYLEPKWLRIMILFGDVTI